MTPPDKLRESDLDAVFRAARAEDAPASKGFRSRVDEEIDAVSHSPSPPPGMLSIAISTLVQTANVLLGSLCIAPRRKPADPQSAAPTGPTDP